MSNETKYWDNRQHMFMFTRAMMEYKTDTGRFFDVILSTCNLGEIVPIV